MSLLARALAHRLLLALAVALVTGVAFLPGLAGEFVDFDDIYNFTLNQHFRGLGLQQLAWMAGLTPSRHFWGPLTWLTHGVDWLLWGLQPFGYHLGNLLLHAAAAGLLVLVAERLLSRALPAIRPAAVRTGAVTAALFWSLHPLRVESVTWISERRDVLSGLWLLLAVYAWLRGLDGAPGRRWRAAAVVAYALSMLAKPIGMTLPVVLLVLEVYPLRRLALAREALTSPATRSVLRDKLPFVAVAIGGGLLALALTHEVKGLADHPLWVRPALFAHGLAFSLWKTIFPLGLIPLYEIPVRWDPTDPRFVVGGLVTVTLAAGLVAARRRWPAITAAAVAYAVMLAPVSGLVTHGGPQIAADRYTYLPALALALLVGGGAALVVHAVARGRLQPRAARMATAALGLWLAGSGALTWQQTQIWRDSVALWHHATVFAPDCARCLHGLGLALYRGGAVADALEPLQRAVSLRPDLVDMQPDLGLALWAVGRPRDALPYLERASARHPGNGEMRRRLGAVLLDADRPDEARRQFETLIARRPNDAEARLGLVRAYRALGDPVQAERELAALRVIDPTRADRAQRR
jgi:tetratricopeptide (TPR) repeat protein